MNMKNSTTTSEAVAVPDFDLPVPAVRLEWAKREVAAAAPALGRAVFFEVVEVLGFQSLFAYDFDTGKHTASMYDIQWVALAAALKAHREHCEQPKPA